jgi:hypothetical protein
VVPEAAQVRAGCGLGFEVDFGRSRGSRGGACVEEHRVSTVVQAVSSGGVAWRQRVKSDVLVLVARCLSGWRCASYSQPLCRNARYSPRQMTTITTSVSG